MKNGIELLASDSYIIVNKKLIKELGAECAIIIGELVSLYLYWGKVDKVDESGYFYATVADIEERTGLSKHIQNKAIKKLVDAGVLKKDIRGLPAKRFIYIDFLRLEQVICGTSGEDSPSPTSSQKFSQLGRQNFDQLDGQKLDGKNKDIRISNSNKENSTPKGVEKKKEPTQKFTPPNVKQVEEHMREVISAKGYALDAKDSAEAFRDFYESKNWMVGKNRMVKWKAAASGWLRRAHNGTSRNREPTQKKDIFAKSGTDYSQFDWQDDS